MKKQWKQLLVIVFVQFHVHEPGQNYILSQQINAWSKSTTKTHRNTRTILFTVLWCLLLLTPIIFPSFKQSFYLIINQQFSFYKLTSCKLTKYKLTISLFDRLTKFYLSSYSHKKQKVICVYGQINSFHLVNRQKSDLTN